jgi:uncharacterized protein YeaO (DUF488 family)
LSLIVHTARMGFKGSDWLDITRKGAKERTEPGGHRGMGAAFAPSAKLLNEFLRKRQSRPDGETDREWLDYVERYTSEMRQSYVSCRESWNRLLSCAHVCLLCYCPSDNASRCHRTILARDILTKLGAQYMGEIA